MNFMVAVLLSSLISGQTSGDDRQAQKDRLRRTIELHQSKLQRGGLEAVFGKEALACFRRGRTLVVYRVHEAATGRPLQGRAGLRILVGPVTPSSSWNQRLRAAMEDKKNHAWGVEYKCGFDPGVVVRVNDGASVADVLFCFHCTELSVALTGQRRLRKQSFMPGRPSFVRLFKELFPKDRAIQSLKERTLLLGGSLP